MTFNVIPVKPTNENPNIVAARAVPSGLLSDVFASAGTGTQTPADQSFSAAQKKAKSVADNVRASNATKNSAHERYRVFEADFEKQYIARGLISSLDEMPVGTRKDLIKAHSAVNAIHEVADEARADLQAWKEQTLSSLRNSHNRNI